MLQTSDDQVLLAVSTPTGSQLTADCPKGDSGIAKAVLEELWKADRKTNWHLDISNGNITIRTDRHPYLCYFIRMSSMGKGITGGRNGTSIKSLGLGLLERLENMGC